MIKPMNGHWQFDRQVNVGKEVGFIYIIEDTVQEKLYLGKKSFEKGKDWRYYAGSSTFMADREPYEFNYYILNTYNTKEGLSFAETWALCHVMAPASPVWYNVRIEAISFKVTEPPTAKMLNRLNIIRSKYENV